MPPITALAFVRHLLSSGFSLSRGIQTYVIEGDLLPVGIVGRQSDLEWLPELRRVVGGGKYDGHGLELTGRNSVERALGEHVASGHQLHAERGQRIVATPSTFTESV